MSSADFRHIAVKGKVHKSERLFRAAVSAFCALTRPSRSETTQLEDLTLPLFGTQSPEVKRFAAAALSEADHGSNRLIRRLCEEPVAISAPLLIRSRSLSDIELIALIGRHGLPHARAIGRRADLHPTIAGLIRILEIPKPHQLPVTEEGPMPAASQPSRPALELVPREVPAELDTAGAAAERMRDRLRGFMLPAETPQPNATEIEHRKNAFARLKLTALTGNAAFFQTALADALDIDFSIARAITEGGYTSLLAALRALDLKDEQAFLLTAAVFPTFFAHAESIRLFVERYHLMHRNAALDMVRGWKAETAARSFRRAPVLRADNNSDPEAPQEARKAGELRASRG